MVRSRPKLNYGAGRDFGVGPEFGAIPETRDRRVLVKKIGSRDSIFGLVNSTYFFKITNHNQHASKIKYLANLIKKYWPRFRYQKLADFLVCFPPYPNGPEAGREAGWGSEFVPLKKREVGSFILLHKISRTACCFGIRTFLKQYNCYESATNWYTDHQYLAQYSEIINNLQEIPIYLLVLPFDTKNPYRLSKLFYRSIIDISTSWHLILAIVHVV